MIADLPPKRVTRRLVFETPNGNNQATINSVSMKQVIKQLFPQRNIFQYTLTLVIIGFLKTINY